jgi:hypothetical protein
VERLVVDYGVFNVVVAVCCSYEVVVMENEHGLSEMKGSEFVVLGGRLL